MTASLSLAASTAFPQNSPLGDFDGHCDIGAPQLAGSAGYDPSNQVYALSAAGTNMWFGTDQCHFVWKKVKGNFILRARAVFLGVGREPHRKLGLMARASLDPDSPYADVALHGNGLASLNPALPKLLTPPNSSPPPGARTSSNSNAKATPMFFPPRGSATRSSPQR